MREREPSAWFRVGRVLPRRLRERIFEPAYYDLMASYLAKGQSLTAGARRPAFGALVVWTAMQCLGIGFANMMIQNRRPTPAMWRMLGFVAALSFWILARWSYGTS